MKRSFFKKYKDLKDESTELKELKKELEPYIKKTLIDKLTESEVIDKLIYCFHDHYKKITDKLFIKYDLKNELKQGKIFTILVAILIFLFLILITIFFFIMLNSLLGINLIFQMFKYSIFILKWGYTLLKSKGNVIIKYLSNLFPNNRLLKEKSKMKIEGLPIFETYVLKEIDSLINSLKYLDSSNLSIKKEIILELKNIIQKLELDNEEILISIKQLEYKNKVIKDITAIKYKINQAIKKQEQTKKFTEIKLNYSEELEVEEEKTKKIYTKKYKKL